MKASHILLVLMTGSMITFNSCKKWLDVSPKTQVRESEMLKDEQGFKDAITGVYMKMGDPAAYGQTLTMGFMSILSQHYNTTATTSPYYQITTFNYLDAGVKNTIAGIWTNLYNAIGNVNNILAEIDGKKELFTGQNYTRIKGEALALRALMHFDLLRMFGASPKADAQRKAIPYVTAFGVKVSPLLTVQNVIDSCMKDLNLAEQLLAADKTIREENTTDPFLSYTRSHLNYWAVKGLQARILLYDNDKTNALLAAKEVISNQAANFPFITGAEAAASYNRDRCYAREQLFALNVYKMKTYSDALFLGSGTGAPPLSVTSKTLGTLYETAAGGSSDLRFNYQFVSIAGASATTKYAIDNINANYLLNNIPLIKLSEIYYIAAESAPVTADGVAFLNAVRTHRGLNTLPANTSDADLKAAILKEYKKDLYAEGQVFYYFKRLNAPKVDANTIATSDKVYIFPLPDNEIEFGNR
jgi:starch-binding outer membrane protein, SusD/RagB family